MMGLPAPARWNMLFLGLVLAYFCAAAAALGQKRTVGFEDVEGAVDLTEAGIVVDGNGMFFIFFF